MMKKLANKIKGLLLKKSILKTLNENQEFKEAINNCKNIIKFDDAFAEYED